MIAGGIVDQDVAATRFADDLCDLGLIIGRIGDVAIEKSGGTEACESLPVNALRITVAARRNAPLRALDYTATTFWSIAPKIDLP